MIAKPRVHLQATSSSCSRCTPSGEEEGNEDEPVMYVDGSDLLPTTLKKLFHGRPATSLATESRRLWTLHAAGDA